MLSDLSETLEELRPTAFAIAYRMLGSVSDAEDVVQEALLRLHRVLEAGEQIESPRAYLSTITTRIAIDELRSARVQRERYVGAWIPEPLLTSEADDPAHHAETADSLSLAFLIILESLTPEQRAVFLLREVFDYSYAEIAAIVGRSEAAARQLAVRARRRVQERRPRFEATPEQRDELAGRFFAAIENGDIHALEAFLADDVELYGDGGGNVPALAKPVFGRQPVARVLSGWARAALRAGGVRVRRVEINGQPGALTQDAQGRTLSALALDIAGGQIQTIRSIVNPDKLGHLGPVGDLTGLLRAGTPGRA